MLDKYPVTLFFYALAAIVAATAYSQDWSLSYSFVLAMAGVVFNAVEWNLNKNGC